MIKFDENKMKETIKITIRYIFQKKTPGSILCASGIARLTPLDVLNLIRRDYSEFKGNYKYFRSNNAILRRARLYIYICRQFIILSLTAFKGNLVSVPLNNCTNYFAFQYGDQGWHWSKDLACEKILNQDITLEKTRFFNFFQQVRCSSYTQLMTIHNVSLMENLPEVPFGSFPWGHFDRNIPVDPCKFNDMSKDFSVWFATGSEVMDILRKEYDRTVTLLNSIKNNGYKPTYPDHQFPAVVVLKNKSGNVRFINVDGAHRFAVLSALGYSHVVVRLFPDRHPPILEEDVDKWPYVKSGLISRTNALKLFQLYFTLNGTERAKR